MNRILVCIGDWSWRQVLGILILRTGSWSSVTNNHHFSADLLPLLNFISFLQYFKTVVTQNKCLIGIRFAVLQLLMLLKLKWIQYEVTFEIKGLSRVDKLMWYSTVNQ